MESPRVPSFFSVPSPSFRLLLLLSPSHVVSYALYDLMPCPLALERPLGDRIGAFIDSNLQKTLERPSRSLFAPSLLTAFSPFLGPSSSSFPRHSTSNYQCFVVWLSDAPMAGLMLVMAHLMIDPFSFHR